MTEAARRAAEAAARTSYGRLLALIAARSRNIAAAEDALCDAFRAALEVWPQRGVPDNPEAWLLTVSRRNLGHGFRQAQTVDAARADLAQMAEELAAQPAQTFPDERLKLLFVCAHPAIAGEVRTTLMLQTVLGMDAARIADAFLVAPAAMAQRLVRAKRKIREAGIAFSVPEGDELGARLDNVLAAIYAAYGAGWDHITGDDATLRGLAAEAIFLARLVVSLLPSEPEARGLLALMLYCEARRAARRGRDGAFIPLHEQDHHLWSRDMIVEAENHLTLAARYGVFGRFQTEAAIQSVHIQRAVTGVVNHAALVSLYELLAARFPSAGALVGRAAAAGAALGPERGLMLIDAIPEGEVRSYQPYWATRGHLLSELGRWDDAAAAYSRAIELTEDAAVRAYLARRKDRALAQSALAAGSA